MKNISSLALGVIFAVGVPTIVNAADSMKDIAMSAKLTVAASFNPKPPKQGSETITVTVKDAAGKPVKGALVNVASNMPTMSMTGPTLKARDSGNGTYVAKTNLNFATKWTFDVTATAGKQSGKTTLAADVK